MEKKQFHRRGLGMLLLLAVILFGLGSSLYDAQMIHGAEHLARSQNSIAETQTVEAARGDILDRYGRVLVSNRVTYQVALNTDAMEKNRNDILLALIRIARDAGVEWEDTLPITAQPPFRYTTDTPFQYPTTDEEGSPTTSLTRLGRLAVKMKWIDDPTADGAQGAPLPTAEELLEKMRIRNPEEVLEKYPHQLSGGMLQRIMIGIATAMKPALLIADEPTTAIDAITQYEILNELLHIKENHNTAMIFISHDLNAISRVADRIVVLNHGAVVDRGDFQHILHHAQDPYTKLLVEKRADVMRRYTAVLNGKKEAAHA